MGAVVAACGTVSTPSLTDKLTLLVYKSQSVLLKISALFPFDIIPDEVVIDESKVSIVHKDLFGVKSIHSVLIENITAIDVSTGLISATLHLTDSTNQRAPVELSVEYLPKISALRARKLIQGLIQARRNNIDFSKYELRELEWELEQLGSVTGED